jgi:rubrerythrin
MTAGASRRARSAVRRMTADYVAEVRAEATLAESNGLTDYADRMREIATDTENHAAAWLDQSGAGHKAPPVPALNSGPIAEGAPPHRPSDQTDPGGAQ